MQITFLVTFFLFSSALMAKTSPLEKIKSLSLINACRIFSIEGKHIKTYPGQICIFLEDGSFISAHEKTIRRISKENEIIWEKAGHFHHQVNLTPDKQRILALSSDVIVDKSENKRQDKFMILSLDGKILHEQKAEYLFKEAGVISKDMAMMSTLAREMNARNEISHFNSFFEIPVLSKKSSAPFIKTGNIIVNSLEFGLFVLSPDLSKVLHHTLFKRSLDHHVHDVQVNKNGNFIYFNNLANGKSEDEKILYRHSEINEVHPLTHKVINTFSGSPKQLFHSAICGNIQELNSDLWLFTHFLTGTFIYSKSTKKIIASISETHVEGERFMPSQQVTAQDLTKFFSFWRER
jgi:hypothetical protein